MPAHVLGRISCVVFLIATVADAQQVALFKGHEGPILMGRFIGKQVVTASTDQSARVWRRDGKVIRKFVGHTGPLFCLAVSGNGRVLVTGAQDNTARVWDIPSQIPLTSTKADAQGLSVLSISTNGRSIVTGGASSQLGIWDAASLSNSKQAVAPQLRKGHTARLTALALRSDAAVIASADSSGQIMTWSSAVGGVQGLVKSHPATAIVFRSNNQELIVQHDDGVIRTWKLPLPKPKADPATPSKEFKVFGDSPEIKPTGKMASLSGGAQVVAGTSSAELWLIETSGGKVVRKLTGLKVAPQAIVARPDNQRIAAAGSDGRIVIWSTNSSDPIEEMKLAGSIVDMAWSADNRRLAAVTSDGYLSVFGRPKPSQTPQPGDEFDQHQTMKLDAPATSVCFDPDNRRIWTADRSGKLNSWAYASLTQTRQLSHSGAVYAAAMNKDGKLLVTGGAGRAIRVWDATTGRQKFSMSGHSAAVHAVALSPDESLVVSSGADKTIRLWDVTGGRQLKQLATFPSTMYSVAFHPQGKQVAVAGADRKVYLIDVLTGAIQKTMEGHKDYIHCIQFNSTGTRLLSYGYAAELRIWDTSTGKSIWNKQIGRIGNFADFDTTGNLVLLSNGDATAQIFQLPKTAN